MAIQSRKEKESILDTFRFKRKPLVFHGTAMHFYGLRDSTDIDILLYGEDFDRLSASTDPTIAHRHIDVKDLHLSFCIGEYEFHNSFGGQPYEAYLQDAVDRGTFLVVSIATLHCMKLLDEDSPKKIRDLQLINNYQLKQKNDPFL